MLAEILQLRRLIDQLIDLIHDVELLVLLEVAPVKLLLHATEYLEGTLVLYLRLLLLVLVVAVDVARWHGRGVCSGTTTGAWWCSRGDHLGAVLTGQELGWRYVRVEDGGTTGTGTLWAAKGWLALAWVVGTTWTGCVGEAPVEERIVDELVNMLVVRNAGRMCKKNLLLPRQP